MNIAICDDMKKDLVNLTTLTKLYFDKKMIDINIDTYDSAQALLKNLTINYDIYFLDIYMKDVSGIELGRKIRDKDNNCLIIFTTTSTDFALDSYKISAIDYLIKPINFEMLEKSLNRCYIYFGNKSKYIEIIIDRITRKILINDIMYIEIYHNTCIIHTVDNNIEANYTLDFLENLIGGEPFLRCHRSYLINMNFIKNVGTDYFIAYNNDKVLITSRNKIQIKQTYDNYLFKLSTNLLRKE